MKFYVYITTNPSREALYIGVTNNLEQRVVEHYINRGKENSHAGKYYCYVLLFYEEHRYINDAIAREKEIKKWRREKKFQLMTVSIHNEIRLTLNYLDNGHRRKMSCSIGERCDMAA